MVEGVSTGYEKKLEIQGVGYLAAIQNNVLQLRVGFANEVHKTIPAGLTVTCPDQTHIIIKGPDRQKVGQFAAEVRAVRKPEPYKGKGIRYDGEQVRRKAGKTAK
jgi:large subunit ribosomal protein L6